jgi:Cu(I)/Ag(I) efflux system membrane fusion protein
MKRNYIAKLLLLLLTVFVAACKRKTGQHDASPATNPSDTSLPSLLKPANEQVLARTALIKAKRGSRLYVREVQGRIGYDTRNQVALASRVAGRIEKLYVKYNYQAVKKGQLIMELYSPDLAAAQRELLLIQQHGNESGMLEPAKRRLQLLGMDMAQINGVLRSGQIAYRIPVYSNATGFILEKGLGLPEVTTTTISSSGGGMSAMGNDAAVPRPVASGQSAPQNTPVLLREGQYLNAGQQVFSIYQTGALLAEFSLTPDVASKVNRKEKVLIQRVADPSSSISGRIGMIQPVLNAGENFVSARVYLQKTGLKPGELVTGKFPFLAQDSYWLPQAAVLSLGNESVVFKKEGKVFIPTKVKTGLLQNQEVQVLDEIGDWQLALNAQYLVDSESFIRTAKNQ